MLRRLPVASEVTTRVGTRVKHPDEATACGRWARSCSGVCDALEVLDIGTSSRHKRVCPFNDRHGSIRLTAKSSFDATHDHVVVDCVLRARALLDWR